MKHNYPIYCYDFNSNELLDTFPNISIAARKTSNYYKAVWNTIDKHDSWGRKVHLFHWNKFKFVYLTKIRIEEHVKVENTLTKNRNV